VQEQQKLISQFICTRNGRKGKIEALLPSYVACNPASPALGNVPIANIVHQEVAISKPPQPTKMSQSEILSTVAQRTMATHQNLTEAYLLISSHISSSLLSNLASSLLSSSIGSRYKNHLAQLSSSSCLRLRSAPQVI
jgi:hypothetical protein